MSKEAIAHYEAALKEAFPRGATGEVFHHWNEARCLIATEALDKMAENARELGLDYEPVCNKDPQGCWNVRCQLGKKCKNTSAQQEPVAFLANGTRFKISYDSRQSGGQIHGIPPELGGRWVAFVAADDDCHLKLTSPPAQRKPLTDEQIETLLVNWPEDGIAFFDFARAIEAAHGIKENA